MPEVATIGDSFTCGDTIAGGSSTVLVNNKQVAREGDPTTGHGSSPPTTIQSGSNTVFANNKAIARVGDPLVPHGHSGAISTGSANVIAG